MTLIVAVQQGDQVVLAADRVCTAGSLKLDVTKIRQFLNYGERVFCAGAGTKSAIDEVFDALACVSEILTPATARLALKPLLQWGDDPSGRKHLDCELVFAASGGIWQIDHWGSFWKYPIIVAGDDGPADFARGWLAALGNDVAADDVHDIFSAAERRYVSVGGCDVVWFDAGNCKVADGKDRS